MENVVYGKDIKFLLRVLKFYTSSFLITSAIFISEIAMVPTSSLPHNFPSSDLVLKRWTGTLYLKQSISICLFNLSDASMAIMTRNARFRLTSIPTAVLPISIFRPLRARLMSEFTFSLLNLFYLLNKVIIK